MSHHQLLILYATQTGNSQDVAKRIGREGSSYGLTIKIQSLQNYDIVQLPTERFVVFVVATTGQGDVPDQAKSFWKFLFRRSLAPDSLVNLQCAVFGLGDSAYLKFNVVAKKLHNRLKALGANMIIEKGLGDDQANEGYEQALDPWLGKMWIAFGSQVELNLKATFSFDQAPFVVEELPLGEDLENDVLWFKDSIDSTNRFYMLETMGQKYESEKPCMEYPFFAKVTKNERITSKDHFQDTRHIVLDIANSGIEFSPGDVLCMHPLTPWRVIDNIIERLGFSKLTKISVKSTSNLEQNEVFYLRSLIQGVLDVGGASPRRFFFQLLSAFASSHKENERLSYFASAIGREELSLYNKQSGRTVLDVLMDFPSSKPPLEWFLDAVPRKVPRKFSIASSLKAHPNEIQLTVAIIAYKTKTHRMKHGLCTSYLASLDPSNETAVVPCWVERGSLSFSENQEPPLPLILIGPGTGIAPIRSLLQERLHLKLRSSSYLFFGCRNFLGDYYYKDELEEFRNEGILSPDGLNTAFSRDQTVKIYVTHKMLEKGEQLADMIMNKGASIYVSGSANKMPQNVHNTIIQIMTKHTSLSVDESEKLLKDLERTGRYQVESWS
eukprot:g5027.t1